MSREDGEPITKRYRDGFVVETRYAYVYKNGHSAWDGFVWKPCYIVTSPQGPSYRPREKVRDFLKEARAFEVFVTSVKADKPTTREALFTRGAELGWPHGKAALRAGGVRRDLWRGLIDWWEK